MALFREEIFLTFVVPPSTALPSPTATDSPVITDVDECASTIKPACSENAVCVNHPTGFSCTCNQGYFGDGISCFGES